MTQSKQKGVTMCVLSVETVSEGDREKCFKINKDVVENAGKLYVLEPKSLEHDTE